MINCIQSYFVSGKKPPKTKSTITITKLNSSKEAIMPLQNLQNANNENLAVTTPAKRKNIIESDSEEDDIVSKVQLISRYFTCFYCMSKSI